MIDAICECGRRTKDVFKDRHLVALVDEIVFKRHDHPIASLVIFECTVCKQQFQTGPKIWMPDGLRVTVEQIIESAEKAHHASRAWIKEHIDCKGRN